MLKIRQHHLATFENAYLRATVNQLAAHCLTFAPRLCGALTRDGLRQAVQLGVSKAEGYGFTRVGTVRLYIELMILFGSEFDTDPQYPWASNILRGRKESEQADTSENLHTAAVDYLRATEQLSSDNDMAPLERLGRAMYHLGGVRMRHDSFVDEVARIFRCTHEPRFVFHGEARVASLITQHQLSAQRRFQSTSPDAAALIVVCMFELGHQFITDPFWAAVRNGFSPPAVPALEELRHAVYSWLDVV